jgi:hypothetical protein
MRPMRGIRLFFICLTLLRVFPRLPKFNPLDVQLIMLRVVH